jgi:hypothetical protein
MAGGSQSAINHEVPLASASDVDSNEASQINLHYADSNTGSVVRFNPIADNTFYDGYAPDMDLKNFFSRPVTIKQFDWVEDASLTQVFQPWRLYFDDVRVKKKLDNYAFISCNLHLKFMINASPFYYGLGLVSYQPKQAFNQCRISTSTANRQAQFVSLSQRPHVYLYPQNCQGGEIVLPYVNNKNWIRVNSASEFDNMGEIIVTEIVRLQNCNNVTGQSVNVTVFAWAEDVRLCGPTVNLALQSDEYEGPISGPASAVAKLGAKLRDVPIIGKFATATTIGASAVANIARLFGFTNVPTLESQKPLKNDPFYNISSSDISTCVDKLTLDPKNELTIDPRVVGIKPVDELAIANIVTRESYIYTALWTDANVYNDVIMQARVTPQHLQSSLDGGVRGYYLTPMAMVSEMFSYWRGDIIFRFKVIASRYHKGRLRISWDPDGNLYTNPDSTNVVFTKIVDIADEQDFEIRIPYNQATAFCKHDPSNIISNIRDGSAAYTHNLLFDNGILNVRVYNDLTGPQAANSVSLAIFVRGAENLEFASPQNIERTWSHFVPQSEELLYGTDCPNVTTIEGVAHDTANLHSVYMGEVTKSLRPLMRRTCYVYSAIGRQDINGDKPFQQNKWSLPKKIPYYGYDPAGVSTAPGVITPGTNYPANFAFNIPLTWISKCFIGTRGSILYRVNVNRTIQSSSITISRQKRTHTGIGATLDYLEPGVTDNKRRYFQYYFQESGAAGLILQNAHTQNGINFMLPMYSLYRMISTDPRTVYGTLADDDDTSTDSMLVTVSSRPATQSFNVDSSTSIDIYAAAGTDYSVFFFLNVPTMFKYDMPVPAA